MKHLRANRGVPPFAWPGVPFQVALIEPEIPPNTGNIARLCAATGSILHLVGPLGFRIDDRAMKRAGLDYWDAVTIVRHPGWEAFMDAMRDARLFFFSTGGATLYTEVRYRAGDVLVFGSESRGLPEGMLETRRDRVLRLPVQPERVRSLNLATAAGIALYEALRQCAGPEGGC
jgi:tRNA (cytidine/uridine-2'-O-)-methyltransferase